MRINALRRELTETIGKACAQRPPALRRSREEEWLYATDLPGLCPEEQLEHTVRKLTEKGWESRPEGGWLLLRKLCPVPPEDWYGGSFGPEAACCLSLLRRHPERMTAPAGAEAYALIKAGEEGAAAYEQCCGKLHGMLAERLRQGTAFPGLSPRYFGG